MTKSLKIRWYTLVVTFVLIGLSNATQNVYILILGIGSACFWGGLQFSTIFIQGRTFFRITWPTLFKISIPLIILLIAGKIIYMPQTLFTLETVFMVVGLFSLFVGSYVGYKTYIDIS